MHEAGHAVLAMQCTIVREVEEVRIDACDTFEGSTGATIYTIDVEPWCGLVISLAGLTAEAMIYGRFFVVKSGSDLTNALAKARTIAADRRVAEKSMRRLVEHATASRTLPFRDFFVDEISDEELSFLNAGYEVARSVLERHRARHARMAAMLLAHGHVGKATIEREFGSRRLFCALGLGRAAFL